jgi:ATP-dependent Lhr-like helicase
MSHGAFALLAEPIQHCLWRMGWTELRPIQVDAIRAILESECDLIVSAATASGKTEAAFLPILSWLVNEQPRSIGVLYVSPLKALINDQFRRLEELCEHAEIPVHRWHGDVGSGAKAAIIKQPSGVLLITPESLESLFINRSNSIRRLFDQLRFVVIDELHAFVGVERGRHLRSLLFRLEQQIQHSYRIVALSATLGEWADDYAMWLRPHNAADVRVLTDTAGDKTIRFKVYGYAVGGTRLPEVGDVPQGVDEDRDSEHTYDEMLNAFGGRKNLIFANRKDQIERFADALNERSRKAGRPAEFLVHHGSLSKEIREQTEHMMRSEIPFTTLCSSTLELGIDIGNVKSVGQIGPPWSVTSLIQRLGRSGRRDGEPSEMRMFVEESEPEADSDLVDRLYPDLLQAVALSELMLEKWLEPPTITSFDLSTLVQQILSVLAETGGTTAASIFARLILRGAFAYVTKDEFTDLLRSLGSHAIIEQMAEGDLILATEGERIVRSRDFYSAFASTKEFAVLHAGQSIGSLPAIDPPQVSEHLLLAGRRWRVVSVDLRQEEIHVVPSRGKKSARFHGAGGEIHDVVREKMRNLVIGDKNIVYLNARAAHWMSQARMAAIAADLANSSWHPLLSERCLLFTWCGTRTQRTIALLARAVGIASIDRDIALEIHAPIKSARDRLSHFVSQPIDLEGLLHLVPFKERRKYDDFLPDTLLDKSYARDALDLNEAVRRLKGLLG